MIRAIMVKNNLNSINYQIPGYEIFEELGQGGMGVVFRGRQINMDRIVAIKILKPEFSKQPKIVENFLKEAKTLANLNHNNIIKVITLGQHNGNNYFVMEYVGEQSLLEKLNKDVVLKEKEVLDVALQISGALEHLNKWGMVHRDIKPSNILLNSHNIPKL
jgi:serine/threonine protein kinase